MTRTSIVLVVCTLIAWAGRVSAEDISPSHFISGAIGLGISLPKKNETPGGTGLYLEGEYGVAMTPWLSSRIYAGTMLTSPDEDAGCKKAGAHCDVSAKVGFVGVKGRFSAPIPYFSPFLEGGVGVSMGSRTTRTITTHDKDVGVNFDFPVFTMGLSLGKNREVDLDWTFLLHPGGKQVDSAFAIGVKFPVGT
jgi:hypothetical protein